MDIRITKAKVKNHWHYSWWKYLVIAIVCALGVDMLFATTRYQPPATKKIEMYLCNGFADATVVQETLWPALQAAAPDQEQLSVININLQNEDMYANMQFTTYVGAQQGDVLLLPAASVKNLSVEGGDTAFMELTPFIEEGLLNLGDLDLSSGMMPSEDGTMGLYAIPADTLYGLFELGNAPEKSYLCVTGYSGNEDVAAAMIPMLFELYQREKPQAYDRRNENPSPLF